MTAFFDSLHEYHPYDALFVVPVAVSAWLFWKHRRSRFTYFETLFGSVIASTFITLIVMAIIIGSPWALIGVTAGLILTLYLPICAAVGLIALVAAKFAPRKQNA